MKPWCFSSVESECDKKRNKIKKKKKKEKKRKEKKRKAQLLSMCHGKN
jgi:hypothetical protein